MELIEEDCLLCKKCTSVLSVRDSNLYFRLLNRYIFAKNLSDLEFRKIFLEKHLCTECAFKIESVSTFINNVIIQENQLTSDFQCSFCREEIDCIYSSNDLPQYLQKNIILFTKMVLWNVKFDTPWKICLKCGFCVMCWKNIKEVVENGNTNELVGENQIEHDEFVIEKANICSEKFHNKPGYNNSRRKSRNKKTKRSQIIDNISSNDDIVHQKCSENINNNDLSANLENDSVDLNIIQVESDQENEFSSVIKSKFNNINVKTYSNNKHKNNNTIEQLRHIKSVGDVTLQEFRKLKLEIVSNKQLMIEKPYVKLKRLNTEELCCAICHQHFTTKSKTKLHELIHATISTQIDLSSNNQVSNVTEEFPPNVSSYNRYVQNLTQRKARTTKKKKKTTRNDLHGDTFLCDFTGMTRTYASMAPTANLTELQNGENETDSFCDLSNMCEVVYSDDETNHTSTLPINEQIDANISANNDVITIDSDDDDSITVVKNSNDVINKMHSYNKPEPAADLLNSIKKNYQFVFKTYLVTQPGRSTNRNPTPLQNLLGHNMTTNNTQSIPEEQPIIRVRNDLF